MSNVIDTNSVVVDIGLDPGKVSKFFHQIESGLNGAALQLLKVAKTVADAEAELSELDREKLKLELRETGLMSRSTWCKCKKIGEKAVLHSPGNAEAQFNLGLKYANGEGVPQDYVLAHMWLNLARAQGLEEAEENMPKLLNRMTKEQIAEAQKMAREWQEKHPTPLVE